VVVGTLGSVAFLITIALIWAPASHARKLIKTLGVESPRAPQTELAYLNPGSPGSLTAASVLRLAFRVRNVGASTHTYRWTVTVGQPGSAAIVAASGRLRLSDDASRAVPLRIPISCTAPRSRVNVSLGSREQTIGFWLPCPAQTALSSPPSTRLLFINPAKPATRQANGAVRFAFVVDNRSGSTERYRYTATTLTPGRAPVEAAVGSFSLVDDHFGVVRLDVHVVCTGPHSRISVGLGSAHRAIGFWVPCRPPQTPRAAAPQSSSSLAG
jgi:hypothetical protein